MIFSNKDRGLNKKITNVVKNLFEDENSDIKENIKKISDTLVDKSKERELQSLRNAIMRKEPFSLYSTVDYIGEDAFSGCTSLTSIELPNVTSIGEKAFSGCTSLTSIELPNVTSIGEEAFSDCTSLTSLILKSETIVSLDLNSFKNSSIENNNGYIYVPDNLVESYKSTTNWSTYASQIKPISQLPTE